MNDIFGVIKKRRTEVFSLRLTPQEVKQLEHLAKMEDRTAGDMLRILLIREYRIRVGASHQSQP